MNAFKHWVWFIFIMVLILGAGLYLGSSRRRELGDSFKYSLEEYRMVDPALVLYEEIDPITPTIDGISALAIGADGQIYVAGEGAIETFPGGKRIDVSGKPSCLAMDDDGVLFAGMRDHVEVYSSDGKKTVWASPGGKAYLTSIALDDDHVYVADAGSRRIWRYSKGGGEPLEIGKKDESKGVRGFFIPSPFFDMAVSRADGSLWVVNPGHHALENYRTDGMPLSAWEATSMRIDGFSGCCNPSHFALLADGAFVTAEKGLPRVKIHNIDGSLRCVVATPDQFEEGVTGLDVAVDAEGRIHVLDPSRNVVRRFEEKQ